MGNSMTWPAALVWAMSVIGAVRADGPTTSTAPAPPASAAASTTIYLSPKGNDAHPGTRDQPKLSFFPALAAMKAGQTLVLLPGDYELHGQHNSSLIGTEASPIVVRGEGRARLFSGYKGGGDGKVQFKIVIGGSRYLSFENLEFQGGGFTVGSRSEHIAFRNCHIHDYSNYAIITWEPKGLLIENCRIHGSWMEHGIYLSKATKDVVIRGCEIWDTAINGIHINAGDIDNVLVENCIFHHNSREWGACITLLGARTVTVRNNVMYCNMGHIFTITDSHDQGEGDRNLTLVNNTIYQPRDGRAGQVIVGACPLTKMRFENNVICTNAAAFDLKPSCMTKTTVFDHNVYGPACGNQMQSLDQDKHSLFGAQVRFVKAPNLQDTAADLRLQAGAPGAQGAPLLQDAPTDCRGAKRRPDGPYGAYASPGP